MRAKDDPNGQAEPPPTADHRGRPEPPAVDRPHAQPKPLLMVDIDGVISLFGFPPADRRSPSGWASAPWEPASGECEAPAVSPQTIDGIPHFLSRAAAGQLKRLAEDFELVWASGWEEKAEEYLPRLLGLPAGLPFLRFERSPGKSNAHWKLAAIDEHAGSRALAWIDDAFNDACHAWAQRRQAPTLLVQTAPERGLTASEASLLAEWARGLAATSQRQTAGSEGRSRRSRCPGATTGLPS
ncbi:MAG TPA: HAD domain-containing protein [Solirubrobacteraceae bacterium]|nr:HAD domain-containing protein [Solirubrobacteraceae bacterium]